MKFDFPQPLQLPQPLQPHQPHRFYRVNNRTAIKSFALSFAVREQKTNLIFVK